MSRTAIKWALSTLAVLTMLPPLVVRAEEITSHVAKERLFVKPQTLEDAFSFIGVPKDRVEDLRNVPRGSLVDGDALDLANALIRIRDSRNVEAFEALLSAGSKRMLKRTDIDHSINPFLRQIESGQFIYARRDFKFFATLEKISQAQREQLNRSRGMRYADSPEYFLTFYHFSEAKGWLIGTRFGIKTENGAYRISVPYRAGSRRRG